MPGPSDDVPRWHPPEASDDLPRWEPPPTNDVPRWEPAAAPPPVETPQRWAPAPAAARPRPEAADAGRPPASTVTARAPWWRRRPWAVAWALVLLAPLAVAFLRVLDEWGYEALLTPLAWLLAALFVAALIVAVLPTLQRSAVRAVLGAAGALIALAILLWPVTRVTLDHTPCPARAGVDLGVPAAVGALASWERGEADDAAWRGGVAGPDWRDKIRQTRLIDYQLVDSGCWERVAPVDVTRTWHEFRVTIETGEREPLSKVVVVHTVSERGDWKITSVEGPLP